LTYGTDAAASHITNAYWYADSSDIPCDPSADDARTKGIAGFMDRWNRMKRSKEIELYVRIRGDIHIISL
jgi:hypothetical protein